MLPESLQTLSKMLSRIPGIGPKSAEKLALWFAVEGRGQALSLGAFLSALPQAVGLCPRCGFFSSGEGKECLYCSSGKRNASELCIVEQASDVLDIEESGGYQGLYFVLGGVISPLEGKTVSDLPFDTLQNRLYTEPITELIIALGATTEADVTALYLKETLVKSDLRITVPARGISVGMRIAFAGKKSIAEAFKGRENL